MKPLSERDENISTSVCLMPFPPSLVGMKPLSERDENGSTLSVSSVSDTPVGMKPLSERDENIKLSFGITISTLDSRNEATL